MIETVEELIEVYSLDKEIEENNPVYKDHAVTVFGIYCLLRNRVLNLPFPKDEVKPTDLSVIENNPTGIKPIEAKLVEDKAIEQPSNMQESANYDSKPTSKVNEVPDLGNINLENETAKIITAINERLNKQIASINIVQNAYADGNNANTEDEENSGSNGSSAVNTVNISFAGNDCNQPMLNQPVKKIVENRQPSNNITDKSQEEPERPMLIKSAEDFNFLCSIIKLILMLAAITVIFGLVYWA